MSAGSDQNAFFAAWARQVLRFRLPLLALTIALTAASAYQAKTKLQLKTSLESFTGDESDAKKSLEAFRETFGRDDVFLVMAAGDVFTMDYLQRLKKLHAELETVDVPEEGAKTSATQPPGPAAVATPTPDAATPALVADTGDDVFAGDEFGDMSGFDDHDPAATDGAKKPGNAGLTGGEAAGGADGWGDEKGGTVIDEVISLITMRKVRYENDTLKVGDFLDPFPTADQLVAVKKDALSEPSIVGQVLGAAAKHSLLVVRTVTMSEERSDKVFKQLEAIVAKHQAEGFRLAIAGPPTLTAWLKAAMQRDMKYLFGGAILVMLLVLATLFRHPIGVVAPILVIVMAVVWTVGMMATVGMPMTLITNIMPAFLMAVGLGDAIHLVSVYRDLRRQGHDNNDAIVSAVGSTGIPLLFTTMTTAVGLLSFRLATVDALSEMGTAAAYGVGIALLHSLVFLPIALSFNTKSHLGAKKVTGGDRLDRVLWRLTGLTSVRAGLMTPARSYRTLALAAVIAAVSVAGMSQLQVSHNPLAWLPSSNPLRAVFDEVDREVGGTATVQLLIDTKGERGIKDLDFLRGLEALDKHIAAYRDPKMGEVIGNSMSVLDILRETNKQLHEGDQKFYALPETQRGASDLLFMFENSGPDDLRRLATADLKTTQMSVRVKWVDANAYPPLADYVLQGVKRHLSKHADVRVTGSIYTLGSTVSGLIDNLLRSFGAAFLFITVFMVVLLKSPKLGLVAMVPNLLPILMIMGLMGLTGMPIDMGNLMLCSIAIGIAVDDTIHFLHHFREARACGKTVDEAIEVAVQHAGRAMVATSLVLTLGFSVFLLASMLHLRRFGGLIALTAMFALLVDVAFAPPLLRSLFGGKDAKR
jgi:uncharacterized protein